MTKKQISNRMSKNCGITIKGVQICVMDIPEEENSNGKKY